MRVSYGSHLLLVLGLTLCGCGEAGSGPEDVGPGEETPGETLLQPLPADFPPEVPLYPDATVRFCTRTTKGFNVSLLTSHEYSRLAAFHREEINRRGWTVVSDDESALGDHKWLQLTAESESLKCTYVISSRLDEEGKPWLSAVSVYVEKKQRGSGGTPSKTSKVPAAFGGNQFSTTKGSKDTKARVWTDRLTARSAYDRRRSAFRIRILRFDDRATPVLPMRVCCIRRTLASVLVE